uniref:HMG box domain-containing protein n=1 Tax=Entomoneis paludosa TaxID=265537 RepID=A0A7S3DUJ8_9STRA|mmetsp:Transcript_3832/g.8125  ORF Transcript_3832/g.8125 Transcript_3832/m.8125 type:complete len:262 (+) Transcript_3832:42-827(+)
MSLERPKRPLSAYNLYFRDKRQDLLKQRLEDASQKIGFANMAKTIAAGWNSIDPLSKKHYESLARVEKFSYKKAMTEWKKQERNLKKAQKKKQATTAKTLEEPVPVAPEVKIPSEIVAVPEVSSVEFHEDDSLLSLPLIQEEALPQQEPEQLWSNSSAMMNMAPQQQQPQQDSVLARALRTSSVQRLYQQQQQFQEQQKQQEASNILQSSAFLPEPVAAPSYVSSSSSSWSTESNLHLNHGIDRLAQRLDHESVDWLPNLF